MSLDIYGARLRALEFAMQLAQIVESNHVKNLLSDAKVIEKFLTEKEHNND